MARNARIDPTNGEALMYQANIAAFLSLPRPTSSFILSRVLFMSGRLGARTFGICSNVARRSCFSVLSKA